MATDEAIPLRADIEWANTTLVFHPVGLAPPVPLAGRPFSEAEQRPRGFQAGRTEILLDPVAGRGKFYGSSERV